jgi:succinyl-diaminopimelate desuccinylase
VERFVAAHPGHPGSVALLITSDEEGPSVDGTVRVVEALKARVVEILDRHGLEYGIAWTLGGKPFLTKRGRLVETLVRAVKKVSGVTPEINCTGGTSDGRFIIDICPEVAEFGPVNRSIHKVNEAVALEEIEPLAEVYRVAVEDLLLAR